MYGVNMLAPPGLGHAGRPAAQPGIPKDAEAIVDKLENRVDAGKLDAEKLTARLEVRFGERAHSVIGEDGSINFDALKNLIVETRSEKLQARLEHRFGEAAEGIVNTDGSLDTERLKDLFAGKHIEQILDRLEKRFGDEVKGVFGEDGSIDFEALKALLTGSSAPVPAPPPGPASGPASESTETAPAGTTGSDDAEISATPAPETAPGETTAAGPDNNTVTPPAGAADQLYELRKTLFEARLERHFGEAAQNVFTDDGKIDTDALRSLFKEQNPGHTPNRPGNGRGLFMGPPVLDRPFFDIRA